MRIKHIYITKEGEPMGNPEMPLPLHFKEEFDYTQDDIEDYSDGMKKWYSGLLPFEDRDDVKLAVNDSAKDQAYLYFDGIHLRPDTLIPVDLEVEVVEQYRFKNSNSNWSDVGKESYTAGIIYEYRKVLRIKP